MEHGPQVVVCDRDTMLVARFAEVFRSSGVRVVRTGDTRAGHEAFAERFAGTLRRESLDHVLILSENHLCRVVTEYVRFYNEARPHQALGHQQPIPRPLETNGRVLAVPVLGGFITTTGVSLDENCARSPAGGTGFVANTALDAGSGKSVRSNLEWVVGAGKTVLQSSHNRVEVEGLCHHVAVLRDRRLIAQNDIAAVRE